MHHKHTNYKIEVSEWSDGRLFIKTMLALDGCNVLGDNVVVPKHMVKEFLDACSNIRH